MREPLSIRRSRLRPALALLISSAALGLPAAAQASGSSGAVYTETNQPNNQVVVYSRAANGAINEVQRINTGGAGHLQNPPFPQDHLDAVSEINLTSNGRLLFAVNAGSDSVSSFRVGPSGRLTLADQVSSGGVHPVSVDSHNGLLYVLNELDPSGLDLVGFRYTPDGTMTPIPGATSSLATPFSANNGFGFPSPLSDQVLFSPDGTELTVPERTSNGFQGQIDTYAVLADGALGPVNSNASNDYIPFGMEWDGNGHLIVANGGSPLVSPPFQGSGSSYSLSGTTLTPIDNESSTGLGTCWLAITNSSRYVFMSNQNSQDISRYSLSSDGHLTLLGKIPTSGPAADMSLTRNGQYLYVLNVLDADGAHHALIDTYKVQSDGTLVHLSVTNSGVPDSASGLVAQ